MAMDKELASHIGKVAFRCSAQLGELIPLLQDLCDKDEYKEYSELIGILSAQIGLKLLGKIYKEHPELEEEFHSKIQKYGILI